MYLFDLQLVFKKLVKIHITSIKSGTEYKNELQNITVLSSTVKNILKIYFGIPKHFFLINAANLPGFREEIS